MESACISAAHRPQLTGSNTFSHCANEVNNGSLATCWPPSQTFVESKKHWRPRTKIEWYKFPDFSPLATWDRNFLETTLLHMIVPDNFGILFGHNSVRKQFAVTKNARKVCHICNVVYRNLFRIMRHSDIDFVPRLARGSSTVCVLFRQSMTPRVNNFQDSYPGVITREILLFGKGPSGGNFRSRLNGLAVKRRGRLPRRYQGQPPPATAR